MAAISDQLKEHRRLWNAKPILQIVYGDWYDKLLQECPYGRILEIGGGTGNLKSVRKEILSLDIQEAPWLDIVSDAHQLPIDDGSIDAIVMVDLLHHLERPRLFFDEALRILREGGRLIMVEPAITLGSWFFWKFLHPEPVDFDVDPLAEQSLSGSWKPWDANQAIPTMLFRGNAQRFRSVFPELKIKAVSWFSFLAYPLSGGFRPWQAIPSAIAPALLRVENGLSPYLGRWFGFRLMVVLEKNTAS